MIMHEAYEVVSILEKLPFQIECISAYDGNLALGTKQGHLLMYNTVAESYNSMKVSLARSNKNFSRKPINQIVVVPEHQILVSLSDQLISVHDLSLFNFPHIFTLQKTKGASSFDLDVQHHTTMTGDSVVTIRMVVPVRRSLQFYYWKSRMFHELRTDVTLNDLPRSVTWCGETICVAFKQDYWTIKIDGDQKELFLTGKKQEPGVTFVSDDCLALQRDEKTVFVNSNGESVCNYTLNWPEQPTCMVYEAPYMIGILSKSFLVQSYDPKMHIQSLNIDKLKYLTKTKSFTNKKFIYAASTTNVWCLCPRLISQQIPQLLSSNHFELAVKLADVWEENAETKTKMKRHIEKLHGFYLFCQFKFKEAMKLFLNLQTDFFYVVGLFPGLIPDDYRNKLQYPHPVPQLDENQLKDAMHELIDFLLESRHQLVRTKKSMNSSNTTSPAMKNQYNLLQIIDTTLLKSYLKTNESLVVPLLRMPDSHVSLEEAERVLRQSKKFSALLVLLQSRKQHIKALQLLLRHSKREDSPLNGHLHTVKYLQALGPDNLDLIFEYGSWVIKENKEDGLKIFIGDEFSQHDVELLNRTRVYSFLKKTNKSLVIPYLEHVIYEWKDTMPVLHNELINHYREVVMEVPINTSESTDVALSRSTDVREKLLHLLKTSNHYTAATLLVHFPHDGLHEERAIILGRLGQHNQALKIYLEVLDDFEKALEYCSNQYEVTNNSELYTILLRILLGNGKNVFSRTDVSRDDLNDTERKVLYVLENFSHCFNFSDVLNLLPDTAGVQILKPFLQKSLHYLVIQQNEHQIERGFCKAVETQARRELCCLQQQFVLLTNRDKCNVCKKRFTSSSAFAWLPTGGVVHFSCKDK